MLMPRLGGTVSGPVLHSTAVTPAIRAFVIQVLVPSSR
jgi:hypothetical protein